ncbi:TPA: restriction endonuclease subunit S [Pseudomonas aeruginosa]
MSEFPSTWEKARIGDICDLINGRAFRTHEWSDSGLPIIRIQNLNNHKAKFNYFSGQLDTKHLVKPGDLLFAWSGTPGTSFGAHIWQGPDAALNQHIFKIAFLKHRINSSYLCYAINQKLGELTSTAQGGVGLKHITKGVFESTEVPLPSLAEQQQIAQKLQDLLTITSNIKSKTENTLNLLKRFRQSILTSAISGKLTEDWRKTNTHEAWRTVKTGEIIEKIEAGKNLKCIERPPKEHEYGIIKISAVTWGEYNENESKTLPRKEQFTEERRINQGDFLISRANTLELVGNPVIVKKTTKNLMLSDKVLRLVMPENEKAWLKIFMTSDQGRREIESRATGNQLSMRNISQKEILDIPVPNPGKTEKLEIINRVEQLSSLHEHLKEKLQSAKESIDKLPKSILEKAFTGELTNDWRIKNQNLIIGEHSASALLQAIKTERNLIETRQKSKESRMSRKTEKTKNTPVTSILDALEKAGKPLSGQQLMAAAGYPSDSNTDQLEQFFLDIRNTINQKQIIKQYRDDHGQDWFSLPQMENI